MRILRACIWMSLVVLAGFLWKTSTGVHAAPIEQQPTVSIPTVTGTPSGPSIFVPEQVNVRSGPGTNYEQLGILVQGSTAPAIGRSPGGEWIMVVYAGGPDGVGWVYTQLVRLDAGQSTIPIVEPPPTPTSQVTSTIDPTLAAQFNITGEPTRLPTFTPAEPIVQVTFGPVIISEGNRIPPILPIAGLLLVGMFGLVISFLRGG